MLRTHPCTLFGWLAVLFALTATCHADWLQFRGNDATGVVSEETTAADLPIAWTAPLSGRGLSSPIIVGDRVIVTSARGYRQDRLLISCFSAKDGSPLWERSFWATGRTISHPKTCNASSTPASDGQRIFALYSSNDLICVDLDGNLQWCRGLMVDFPNASNSLGMASSPLVVAGTLVVQIENDSQSLAVGIDRLTGESKWTSERPKRANWTSAAILKGRSSSDDLVLLQSSAGLAAVEPETGKVVWNYTNGASTIPSSTVQGETIYVPSHGITALRMSPGSANPEVVWQSERLGPGTASPIVVGDNLYVLNRAGVLLAAAKSTGEIDWQQRLEGPFSSTPVAAGGYLFFFNENGLAQVVKPGEKGEIVAKKELGETILSTPSVDHGAIFVRSDGKLWKLGS